MDITSKIGTYVVTISAGKPNQKLINKLTRKRAPLTPDLFPFYAGTLEDYDEEYDDYYEEESNMIESNQYLENESNANSIENLQAISSISQEVENNVNNSTSTNQVMVVQKNVANQLNEFDHSQKDLLDELDKSNNQEIKVKVADLNINNEVNESKQKTFVEPTSDIQKKDFNTIIDTVINSNHQDNTSTKIINIQKQEETPEPKKEEPILVQKEVSVEQPTSTIINEQEIESSFASSSESDITEPEQQEQKQEEIDPTVEFNKEIKDSVEFTNSMNKTIDDVFKEHNISDENTKVENVEVSTTSIADQNIELPNIGHDHVFIKKAKDKDEYYSEVLDENEENNEK